MWAELHRRSYWCLNTDSADDAYDLLSDFSSLRFSDAGEIEPNIEMKFVKTPLDLYTLRTKVHVTVGDQHLFISSIEVQIAFKMYLGSEKDLEDARHLWIIFKEHLNREKLKYFADQLRVVQGVFNDVTR